MTRKAPAGEHIKPAGVVFCTERDRHLEAAIAREVHRRMPGHAIVVEDNQDARALYSKWLQRAEIPHEVCESAEVARARLRNNGVTLALVDVGLPGEDGLDLAKWIRARHPDINVVLLTGSVEAVDRELHYDAILKPVHARQFCDAVRRLLREANQWQSIVKLKRSATRSRTMMKLAAAIVAAIQTALAGWMAVQGK